MARPSDKPEIRKQRAEIRTVVLLAAACAVGFGLTVPAEMTFDRAQLVLAERDGMTTVSLGRCVSAWETGAPAVPIAVAQLVVPQDMVVTGVTVTADEGEVLEGEYDIYPVQPPRPISDPNPPEFAGPDPKYYTLAAYPGRVATFAHQGSMFGYQIASVFIAPVQYDGTTRKLTFHRRVAFELELAPGETGALRPGNRSAEARRRLEAIVAGIVLNPGDVFRFAPGGR